MRSSAIFPAWWQALSSVPPSKTARDWWAKEDARAARYDRLYRVWGDPTDRGTPPYYCPEKEKHLVITLWENFAIFHPADTVAAIYQALDFEAASTATDLCWSCEFNLAPGDRQLDIVMHVRFPERDEIIVGEAKVRNKRYDEKDLAPRDILSRDVFQFAGTRRYFLLGDASPPEDWQTRGYRHLTWHGLFAIQSTLSETLPEPPSVRKLVGRLIDAQFNGHNITTKSGEIETNIVTLQRDASVLFAEATTQRCRDFIVCAIQHLRCQAGLPGDSIPHPYLASEPKVEQITRRWRIGCGSHAVNGKPYWKLPQRLD